MRSTIAGLGQAKNDDPLLQYLHHVSIVVSGPIHADDIFEQLENTITGRTKSLAFLDSLSGFANNYAAILTPSDPKWGGYDQRIRILVHNISQEIKMTFIRVLMLAVASKFTPKEAIKAYRAFNSWVVRFLIAGGSRSGVVEKAFGESASAIARGEITTAKQLIEQVRNVIPSDVKFHAAFRTKSIATARQARFILFELESEARGGSPDALMQPVKDTATVTLEHILPKNPAAANGWDHFSADKKKAYRHRLGNLALLDSKDNGAINDKSFGEKRPVIEKSRNLLLTKDVIDNTSPKSKWEEKDIEDRQERLAALAMKRWPIAP